MSKRSIVACLVLALLVAACGGSSPGPKHPEPEEVEVPPPDEEQPAEEAAAEPVEEEPPAPDPAEELAGLLAGLSEDVKALSEQPWKAWAEGAKRIEAYDAELAAYEEKVPDEAKRIATIRGKIKDFTGAVGKKKKAAAQKALKALSAELAR